jgi:tryptophan-rich sensory protein
MRNETVIFICILLFPSVLGGSFSYLCNVKETSGSTVNIRPDPEVFGIVWPILYILLGLSWYYARNSLMNKYEISPDLLYIILNIFLCLWIYVYSCKGLKKEGVYVLILCIIAGLSCFTVGNITSKLLITPLLGWLYLATLLNVFEVEKLNSNTI